MTTDLIGTEILGQFRILERIGKGGMGEVFKAAQPAMDRMVAIKVLDAKLANRADLVSRFRREARAMSRLSHPNTVRVFLYGQLEETKQLYIVMEYLDGLDLARTTRKDGPMEPVRAARIMIQVLGALEEAHGVGIVHRDLKPENILLTTQGGITDFPKVLDFGLAKIRDSRPRPGSMILTQEGMVFGTPEFMSPEQARGETLDGRTDVYSAAVILYEMVTARLPFPRSQPMEYIAHHMKTPPIPVSERCPELNLPKALDAIIGKALEKDRDRRYQSAREFAEALRVLVPASGMTSVMRSVPVQAPREEAPPTSRVRLAGGPSTAPGAAGGAITSAPKGGRGLVIALVAIIVVLLIMVAGLIVTRSDLRKPVGTPPPAEVLPAPPPSAAPTPPPAAPTPPPR